MSRQRFPVYAARTPNSGATIGRWSFRIGMGVATVTPLLPERRSPAVTSREAAIAKVPA